MARTLLITGMSGAGKTQVMRTLEDLGYFCVDNLPPTFIPKFIELCLQNKNAGAQLALVVDIRGGKFFKDLNQVLDQLNQSSMPYELVFLDADDATLIRRYKETRRRHPDPETGHHHHRYVQDHDQGAAAENHPTLWQGGRIASYEHRGPVFRV